MKRINNRYLVIKKIYPYYIILIKQRNKYITLLNDNEILTYLNIKKPREIKRKKINYLILDNLEITEKKDYKEDNKYKEYFFKVIIQMLIAKITERQKLLQKKIGVKV